MTHARILREVWGPAYQREANYLHVYVSQLRRKIEDDPARPQLLLTAPGLGYRLVAPNPKTALRRRCLRWPHGGPRPGPAVARTSRARRRATA